MTMLLDEVQKGQSLRVLAVRDSSLRAQLLRMGLCEGSVVRVVQRISRGPALLRWGSQELALGGRHLALLEVYPVGPLPRR